MPNYAICPTCEYGIRLKPGIDYDYRRDIYPGEAVFCPSSHANYYCPICRADLLLCCPHCMDNYQREYPIKSVHSELCEICGSRRP